MQGGGRWAGAGDAAALALSLEGFGGCRGWGIPDWGSGWKEVG